MASLPPSASAGSRRTAREGKRADSSSRWVWRRRIGSSAWGGAIALACIERLYAHGAEEVSVETDAFRNAALALYEAVGFRVQRDVLVYRKDYPLAVSN